jgi:hypothetical protein
MSAKPDRSRPAIAADSRMIAGCGLIAQVKRQYGTCLKEVGRCPGNLIIAKLAAPRSWRARVF